MSAVSVETNPLAGYVGADLPTIRPSTPHVPVKSSGEDWSIWNSSVMSAVSEETNPQGYVGADLPTISPSMPHMPANRIGDDWSNWNNSVMSAVSVETNPQG